nr:ribonuclease H-like domain-containing protein [Tanacetum cinerariifolium]
INQIDEDDMEEMDIKWNMALLSMRADRFWKKTEKKISIQGIDVAGFDKSKDTVLFPPPPAQVYSPPKKDMSWTGIPEFTDDTVTDYSRPSPAIESTSDDAQIEILLFLRLKHHLVPSHLNLSLNL